MVENFLKICPACGFSFNPVDRKGKYRKTCPQCGYKITEPSIIPPDSQDFDRKII